MKPTREQVYLALLAKLQTVANFVTVSRRFIDPNNLTEGLCPALIQIEVDEDSKHIQRNLGPIMTLHVDVTIVVCLPQINEAIGQETQFPQTILNPIIDAIEAAFAPDNISKNKFTLGGLVEHCYIEGKIEKDQGVLFPKALAIVPVEILLANPATS
jgi:hypothetical protein